MSIGEFMGPKLSGAGQRGSDGAMPPPVSGLFGRILMATHEARTYSRPSSRSTMQGDISTLSDGQVQVSIATFHLTSERRQLLAAHADFEADTRPASCGIMDSRPWLEEGEPTSGLSRLYRD